MQHFLRLEQAFDVGFAMHHLPFGRDLKLAAVEQNHLVAPEAERLSRLENFIV